MKKNILLTTVLRPIESYGPGLNPLDLFGSRLTVGQDVFTINYESPTLALHYIAQNIQTPTTVMEYPNLRELKTELKKGYSVVGVTFSNTSIESAFQVCRTIRKYSPDSEIILGGYGVQCLNQFLEDDVSSRNLYDHVCREEGVTFMRRFLGEATDRSLTSNLPPQIIYPLGARFIGKPIGPLIHSFGCNSRCSFCSTSAFYNHRFINVMDPRQFATQAIAYLQRYPGMDYLTIFCENFLTDKSFLTEVWKEIETMSSFRQGDFAFNCLTSVQAISSYSADELAALGIGSVWIGVESRFSNLTKRRGCDIEVLFRELHEAGIQTTGSFIIGQDEQSTDNIEEDIDFFTSLEPTLSQVSALVPGPEVKLWDSLKREGRVHKFDWNQQHVYAEVFDFKGFKPGEVLKWIDVAILRLYRRLGPSLMRSMQVWCNGMERYQTSSDERLRLRAAHLSRLLGETRVLLKSFVNYAPSAEVREKAIELSRRVAALLGPPTLMHRLTELGVAAWLIKNRITGHGQPGRIKQPRRTIKRYNA